MMPLINRQAPIHHDNRPGGITKRTVRPISLRRSGSLASLTGNTEEWAKFATAKRSPTM
jgi:hypothetical protein